MCEKCRPVRHFIFSYKNVKKNDCVASSTLNAIERKPTIPLWKHRFLPRQMLRGPTHSTCSRDKSSRLRIALPFSATQRNLE